MQFEMGRKCTPHKRAATGARSRRNCKCARPAASPFHSRSKPPDRRTHVGDQYQSGWYEFQPDPTRAAHLHYQTISVRGPTAYCSTLLGGQFEPPSLSRTSTSFLMDHILQPPRLSSLPPPAANPHATATHV